MHRFLVIIEKADGNFSIRPGIPYQTLISSKLHKLVSGKLKEVA
jgi:predicted DNA binding CopG/RHH family protein